MSKKNYRVRNWKQYNESLVKRGSITFWFDEESLANWYTGSQKLGRGRPEKYSDKAIHCGLTLKALLGLTLRSTEGFLKSLMELMGLEIDVPDYTSLCKRQKMLDVKLPLMKKRPDEKLDIVVDTTGLKIYGEGEWRVRTHGKTQRRRWRKVHLAINSLTQEIEACCLTEQKVQDCQGLPMLLNQIKTPVNKVIADGAYDRFSCYEEAERRKCEGLFPPQHNASTSKKEPRNKKKGSVGAVLKRDKAIEEVTRLGRKEWKIKSGYHKRSLAETGMFRLKTLFGDRLSARHLENQQTELNLRCYIINRMTALGMPKTMLM
jgi:IS5 family transposase